METIINLVRPDAMTSLITEWCDDKSSAGEGLFLTREKKNGKPIYTACDNSKGDCWVEDFRDWKTAVLWLLGKLATIPCSTIGKLCSGMKQLRSALTALLTTRWMSGAGLSSGKT